MEEKIIQFVRSRDYVLVQELGQGACGRTVLPRDDQLGQMFVCKKYSPLPGLDKPTYYQNFVREIKLLHQLNHVNVVRVFNYYLYPESWSGYILMEHVSGQNVQTYLRLAPERANEVFEQAIKGFKHLEMSRVLHRDIRPDNLLVDEDGIVKIIDLGFGKKIDQNDDFDKSISLNWWCELPDEFRQSIYDYSTEVYFLGKLFEKILLEEEIEHFKYRTLLSKMCTRSHDARLESFVAIDQAIESNLFYEIEFSLDEMRAYRSFADAVNRQLIEVERGKYVNELERLKKNLEDALRKVMLEKDVPEASMVLGCLLNGAYKYRKNGFPVDALRGFVRLLKSVTVEKQRVLLANLHSRLDAVDPYKAARKPATGFEDMDDDIPF
jgi:eukaryotic-like serine/threonine-protein kinase